MISLKHALCRVLSWHARRYVGSWLNLLWRSGALTRDSLSRKPSLIYFMLKNKNIYSHFDITVLYFFNFNYILFCCCGPYVVWYRFIFGESWVQTLHGDRTSRDFSWFLLVFSIENCYNNSNYVIAASLWRLPNSLRGLNYCRHRLLYHK